MTELGNNLRNESLKNKKRKKLEREWDLKNRELTNYLWKLTVKIHSSRTEERKKLEEERKTIFKILHDSNPHIDRWNPFRIQEVVEKVYKKAQEKKLDTKLEIKKTSNFKIIKQKNKEEWLYFLWLKELAEINPDPKLVRPVLLAWRDYDEGRIDEDTLKRLIEEFKNPKFNREEFMEKYPIFNPNPPKKLIDKET